MIGAMVLAIGCGASSTPQDEPDAGASCGTLGRACASDPECDDGMTCVIVGEQGFCGRPDMLERRECVEDADCDAGELCEWGRGIVSDGRCTARADLVCLCMIPDAASGLARCTDL
ncbi:Hypothetical protein I5071_75580 [Sandaracinus amylolyticus]|nr:Hypothetical protein I5071_75580 [Sandaracinus amylolyticus]